MQNDQPPVRVTWKRRPRHVAIGLLLFGIAGFLWEWLNQRSPVAETEIYRGVTYGCDRLIEDVEGRGLVHWVRIDLAAPGVEVFVTPMDPSALAEGWQFRLRTVSEVVRSEGLAAATNACLFTSHSGTIPLSGDLARSVETVIADHKVSHVWDETYLLWFEDDLTPHLETSKPPPERALKNARWAVGGQGVALNGGAIRKEAGVVTPDARTAIGIDRDKKLLFLAVFEYASPHRAMATLAALGARDGMLLDGGDSTSMALGAGARGVRPGSLMRGWRSAVATHFGVRAHPLPSK